MKICIFAKNYKMTFAYLAKYLFFKLNIIQMQGPVSDTFISGLQLYKYALILCPTHCGKSEIKYLR